MARRSALPLLAALLVVGGLFCSLSNELSARTRLKEDLLRDHTRVGDLARRYGLEVTWVVPGEQVKLHSRWTTLSFEAGTREATWNGIRLFLGEPVKAHHQSLYLSPSDLKAIVRPLLDPSAMPAPGELKLIVIDAGHGGADPGTENRKLKLKEKTFTLDVARRLKKNLEQRGYRVALTRSTDAQLARTQTADLRRRVEFANRSDADLFISIHFNSLPDNDSVSGIETYALTPAGQRSTASLRSRRVDRMIYPANRYDHWNTVLSASIQPNLLDHLGAVDRGLKRARFAVLRTIECPAVLVEAGFLSNQNEARKIGTAAYRQNIAEAIGDGIGAYAARLRATAALAAN